MHRWKYGQVVNNDVSICAVIVTYNPDKSTLFALISNIKDQVESLVIIDNASDCKFTELCKLDNIFYIQNSSNLGLATALNIGIEWAFKSLATHVILFDQDSLPDTTMVNQLLHAEQHLVDMGIKVAAVGPNSFDVKSGKTGSVIGEEWAFTKRKIKPDFENFIEAAYLMSSGQLIRIDVLKKIGLMKSELFIDAIDIEWSLRARFHGFRSFVVVDEIMRHNLGDKSVGVGSVIKYIHSPERHYYIIRNALLLCKYPEIPLKWKITDIIKTVRRFVAYPLLCDRPCTHLKWMIRGLRDGLVGITGKYNYDS